MIDDLIPGSRYKFRIKAENSYGISDPGEESNPFDVGGVSADRFVVTTFLYFCLLFKMLLESSCRFCIDFSGH